MLNEIELKSTRDDFRYRWSFGHWCNFRCSYCFQNHEGVTKLDEDYLCSLAVRIAAFIDRTKPIHNKKVNLSLMGGEVSQYNLIKILEPLWNHIDILSMVTNTSGSCLNDVILKCKEHNIKCILNCSYHGEYYKPEDFVDKCKQFKKLGATTNVLAVMTNNNYDINEKLYDLCIKAKLNLAINPERSDDGLSDILLTDTKGFDLIKESEANKTTSETMFVKYDDNTRKTYHSRRDFISYEGNPDITGWLCDINTKMVTIDTNGNVYPVFCHKKPIASLEEYEISAEPVKCTRQHCAYCFPCKRWK